MSVFTTTPKLSAIATAIALSGYFRTLFTKEVS